MEFPYLNHSSGPIEEVATEDFLFRRWTVLPGSRADTEHYGGRSFHDLSNFVCCPDDLGCLYEKRPSLFLFLLANPHLLSAIFTFLVPRHSSLQSSSAAVIEQSIRSLYAYESSLIDPPIVNTSAKASNINFFGPIFNQRTTNLSSQDPFSCDSWDVLDYRSIKARPPFN